MENRNYQTAKESMVQKEVGRIILTYAEKMNFDVEQAVTSNAIEMLEKITNIIQNSPCYPNDEELVEKILDVFREYGISTGVCHDY